MIMHMILVMAVRALRHHTVRSFLTLLGIVIGIAGIIAISAVGKGTQKKARDQYVAYGIKTLGLYAGNWMSHTQKPPKPLRLEDVDIILQQCPAVQYATALAHQHRVAVEYEGNNSSADIVGSAENKLLISEERILHGNFFSRVHVDHKDNVAVLSPEMTDVFFKFQNPINAVIRINKIPFTVIGVLAPRKLKGKFDGIGLPNIFIPLSTHRKYFGNSIPQLELSTYTEQQVPEVIRQLEKIFRAMHILVPGQPNDFMIFDNQTFAQAAEEASKSVGLFALIAAIIALFVGGIGVMNIMLVAVQERTKEIGTKMALGATMNVIRMQFLIEAIIICMLGGLIGILAGIGVAYGLFHWLGILTIIELAPIIISFLATVAIGLGFGFYPAEMAARLNPAEILSEY